MPNDCLSPKVHQMTSDSASHPHRSAHRTCVVRLAIAVSVVLLTVRLTSAQAGAPSDSGEAQVAPGANPPLLSEAELQVVGTHISPNLSAEFTADGKWIVSSGADGVAIHDADSTTCVNWLNGELAEVSPDGHSLLLRRPNGAPELRSIPDGKLIWRLPHERSTGPLHFSDDGQYIVCGFAALLRIETREVVHREPPTYRYEWRAVQPYHYTDGSPADPSIVPHVYRATLRHDGRTLVTLKSGMCSPAGRFMILVTGEVEESYNPLYSVVDRQTGERLFSDIESPDVLFFHGDDFVYHDGTVYRTADGEAVFSPAPGVTAFALSSDESLLAVGWREGDVAVFDAATGKESFRVAFDEPIEYYPHKSSEVVSIAFSDDSSALAVAGRKLKVIDTSSHATSAVRDLDYEERQVRGPQTTLPIQVAFNADGSRLLLTERQVGHFLHSRDNAVVLRSTDLEQLRALTSDDFFERLGAIEPARFSPDGAWAMMPNGRRGSQLGSLRLWDTAAEEPIAEIQHGYDRYSRGGRFNVPDFPKRHLGLGRDARWHADEIVMYPWWSDYVKSRKHTTIPDSARYWLDSFARVHPQRTNWRSSSGVLYHPARQWLLRHDMNGAFKELHDLSTGAVVSAPLEEMEKIIAKRLRSRRAIGVPESCWLWSSVVGATFSPDGSRLLVSWRPGGGEGAQSLGLFEMPSGTLIRSYTAPAEIRLMSIARNNRVAAISNDFYRKTWIIDLESGDTVVELPRGGSCSFSPDSRYGTAQK